MSQIPDQSNQPYPAMSMANANSNIVLSGQNMPQDFYGAGFMQQPAEGISSPRRQIMDGLEMARTTPQILILMLITGLKRNWKWTLPAGIILATITFGILWFMFPIKYEATAWIQIRTNKQQIFRTPNENIEYDNFVQTQFALIRSPVIIKKALENPKIAQLACITKEKDRVAWLTNSIKLQRFAKSEYFTLSISTEIAEDAANIVNSIVDAFLNNYITNTKRWNTDLINQLTIEINRQSQTATDLENEIRRKMQEAASKDAVTSSGTNRDGLFAPGESLQRDIYLSESRFASLEAELKMLRDMIDNTDRKVPPAMLEIAINSDPEVIKLSQRRLGFEEKLAKIKAKGGEKENNNEKMIADINKAIAAIDADMTRVKLSLAAKKEYEMSIALRAQADSDIYETEKELKREEILLKSLKERYAKQLEDTKERTVNITDVSFQQLQLKRINNILDILHERRIAVTADQTSPSQIELLEQATPPPLPKTKQRIIFASFGAMAFLIFPALFGIVLERSKPRLYHVSQIRRACPDVIIGEIMEPPVAWIQGASFRKRLARYRETVHSWCTHLLLSDPFRTCRTISIASVSSDDGKTFLAVQVAVAMAQMRTGRVLLIDGDMRVGRLHLLFGNEEAGVGLADVLSLRNRVGEAIVMDAKDSNLHFLSAGNLDVSPYELLGDRNFRDLLDFLERDFSLILVVVPPVTHAAESLVMAASTDSVLLCVRQGETVLAAMEDVYRKLVSTGSNVDGIVVKDIPYYQMAGKDGGFADKLEQIRLSHLLQYAD
ncbi:MAG: hypothetical protein LBP59_20620 [Planctomycetaceae bacterium]|jgi:capsular exopolysaccharide synthesis family protein|nr:hypothetical protein [Planctomycetaceae bacterium]